MKAMFLLCFTVGCGGAPFVAAETAPFDGGTTEFDHDSGGFTVDSGDLTADSSDSAANDAGLPTDKGSTDGGVEAAPIHEPDACPATPAWTCSESDESVDVASGQFCVGVYQNAAVSAQLAQLRWIELPSACSCEDTCACVEAENPCGTYAFVSCTNVAGGGPAVLCNAAGNP